MYRFEAKRKIKIQEFNQKIENSQLDNNNLTVVAFELESKVLHGIESLVKLGGEIKLS